MEVSDIIPLIERLEDNVDDLEEVMEPFLSRQVSLSELSQKLPVLDRAKLHVLITYTLESLIFSYLRLKGVDAKEHPVFREITRVKQYFAKIQALETQPEERALTLDREAAGRFIKHGLAGNDKIDLERAEREAKERAAAQLKAAMLAKRMREESARPKTTPTAEATSEADSESNESGPSEATPETAAQGPVRLDEELETPHDGDLKAKKRAKKRKKLSEQERKESKKERRQRKKAKRMAMEAQ